MAINGLAVIYYAAKPIDTKHVVLLVSMALAFLLAFFFAGSFFAMTALDLGGWLILIVLSLLVLPIQMTFERIFDRCSAFFARIRERRAQRKLTKKAFQTLGR